MIDQVRRAFPRHWLLPLALSMGRLGLSPNALSLVGLALTVVAAALVAAGYLLAGGIMVLLAGAFDMLDGQLARATKQASLFGALLDSTLDRVEEAAVLFGLAAYYLSEGGERGIQILLIVAALEGSLMVSYVKARAEGLGLRCDVGWFQRPERVVAMAIALMLAGVGVERALDLALWLLAVLTNFTALQRVVYVWQQTGRGRP
ncbi:MAG: CDP-alcohol phosphatidyltransferase family protein [Chloroflexi bacterium]|nr:CDP-alcohol phosphatidyltransferase family protein [Chloroflexota bacterium]